MENVHSDRQDRGALAAAQPWSTGEFDPSWLSALGARIRRTVLGLSVDRLLSRVDDHGADPGTRFRLLRTAQLVLRSYNVSLEASPFDVELYLQSLAPELRGLAIEGVAMALHLRDGLRPGQRRIRAFLEGPYARYAPFTHVGCGLMMAKLRRPVAPYLRVFSDLSSLMVIDGYGFGRTVFERQLRSSEVPEPPRQLSDAERRIFDNGVGRALVFKLCGKIPAIEDAIRKIPGERQRDVWQGVGVAIAYNVGHEEATSALRERAPHSALLRIAAGACKASWARAECGNRTEETDFAAERLVGQAVETQLAVVQYHAPVAASGSPEQWLAWWEKVGNTFESMTPEARTS
jgi:hypothetical protein